MKALAANAACFKVVYSPDKDSRAREIEMHVKLNSDIDLDELDALIAEEPFKFSRIEPVRGPMRPSVHVERYDVSSEDAEKAPVAPVIWRKARNIAPLLAGDLMSMLLSGLIAQSIVRVVTHVDGPMSWGLAAVILFPLVLAYALAGQYAGIGVHPVKEIRQIFQLNTIALTAGAIGGVSISLLPFWCGAAWLISIVLVPLTRNAVRRWCAHQAWWGYPILIISSDPTAEAVIDELLRTPSSGLRPVLLTDPTGDCRASSLPVENDVEEVERLIRRESIRYAVMCLPDLTHAQLLEVVKQYSRLIPHLLVASDSVALPSLWGATRACGQLSGLELQNGQMLMPLRVIKRSIDITLASIGILLGAPILLTIALLVKLGSKGPVFYGHTRIGVKGRRFSAWKYRTMYINGDELLRERLREDQAAKAEWQEDQKLRDDPRVTPIGRFLRKWSLDELPQIWNVLCGDMSLVGPRPIVNSEAVRYGESFDLYKSVKPGITGLWQVSGRNDTTYEERVRFDSYYVRNWSPWLDLHILARTAKVVLTGQGAY